MLGKTSFHSGGIPNSCSNPGNQTPRVGSFITINGSLLSILPFVCIQKDVSKGLVTAEAERMIHSVSLQIPTFSYHNVALRFAPCCTYSNPLASLRRSSPLKMWTRAHGEKDPVSRGAFGSQNFPQKITGLSAAMTTPVVSDDLKSVQASSDGIGISDFLEGKTYFVTGATGVLAKVFVEKIMRMSPNFSKIYLLIRAEDDETAIKRFISEIIECEAFQHHRQKFGDQYKKFMLSKLIPVAGDIMEPNLGIEDAEMMNRIIEEVDVIVHSAADTDFDSRYDAILRMNVVGTHRMLELAKNCKKLHVFMHVSTAFVNGTTNGLFLEELQESRQAMLSMLDVDAEIKLAVDLTATLPESKVSQKMREVGLARAQSYGFKNCYELSKAMGEMVIHRSRGQLPVVIVRPSVVESTYQEPFPGWIEGNKVLEPVIISYGKGQLPGLVGNPEVVLDIVPLDLLVNAMVAVMAKHGKSTNPGVPTYNITSSAVNPLIVFNLFKSIRTHFTSAPLVDANGTSIPVAEMKFVDSIDKLQFLVEEGMLRNSLNTSESGSRKNKRIIEGITRIARVYEPYFFNRVRFDNRNTEKLIKEMSARERMDYPMDVRRVDWEHYITNIHIPGVRKHVMKKPMKMT
ncbi:hypothetical protein MLD38_037228 [Melastoma candidum]|uniref:Uncharacterized protein n=1 Tax=Melastoma candidum TaxID=119954 RepID=A0ACB9LME9_9MYRT|nr:hypothetical protein MLD38_037228 [Melastoma candidum]